MYNSRKLYAPSGIGIINLPCMETSVVCVWKSVSIDISCNACCIWLIYHPFVNKKLPNKLLVIWGWYIAVELGHAYGWFGSEVHFFVRSGLVWAVDTEIKAEFEAEFSQKYNIHKNITFNKVAFNKNTWEYTLYYNENWEELSISWDGLLIATGIKINSDTLIQEKIQDKEISILEDYLDFTVNGEPDSWGPNNTLNEEINRMKSLFGESMLYGNIVDNENIVSEQYRFFRNLENIFKKTYEKIFRYNKINI